MATWNDAYSTQINDHRLMDFNDFEWHDSVIRNIRIDRNRPGEQDTIEFEVEFDSGLFRIVFESVYQASFQMNFGVRVEDETIYYAFTEGRENKMVQDFYSLWNGLFDKVNLNYYEIETNSTGSKFQIVAMGVSFFEMERQNSIMKRIGDKLIACKWYAKLKRK